MKTVYKKFIKDYCEYLADIHTADLRSEMKRKNKEHRDFKSLQDYCHAYHREKMRGEVEEEEVGVYSEPFGAVLIRIAR